MKLEKMIRLRYYRYTRKNPLAIKIAFRKKIYSKTEYIYSFFTNYHVGIMKRYNENSISYITKQKFDEQELKDLYKGICGI